MIGEASGEQIVYRVSLYVSFSDRYHIAEKFGKFSKFSTIKFMYLAHQTNLPKLLIRHAFIKPFCYTK